jgi:hypothetical protein
MYGVHESEEGEPNGKKTATSRSGFGRGMMTTTQTSFTRLLDAANAHLADLIDSGEHGPELWDEAEGTSYPRDADGRPWFSDVWELHQAEEAARKDKALYDAAGDLLEACRDAEDRLTNEINRSQVEEKFHPHFALRGWLRAAIAKADPTNPRSTQCSEQN